MYGESKSATIVTASNGSATGYIGTLTGRIASIEYVKPASGGYSDGVDFTITNETTGETIWTEANVNASKIVRPRQPVQDTVGVDIANTYQPIMLAVERVKIVIANGGNVLTGTFRVKVM